MHTHEANRAAVADCAKAIRLALLSLGMRRCSLRLVYRQCEPPVKSHRLDWYSAFWRWFEALWTAHPSGAEFLFEDLCARIHLLREGAATARGDWYEQLARCEQEHSEAIRAAILDRDPSLIRKEMIEAIAALRQQLAMLDARQSTAA